MERNEHEDGVAPQDVQNQTTMEREAPENVESEQAKLRTESVNAGDAASRNG